MLLEGVEVLVPVAPVRGYPLIELAEGFGAKAVEATLRVDLARHEVGVAKNLEVLGDCGLREPEHRDEIVHASRFPTKEIEDLSAGGLGDHLERREHTCICHNEHMPVKAYALSPDVSHTKEQSTAGEFVG